MATKGARTSVRRIFAAMQAISIFEFTMRRRPKTSDVGALLPYLLDNTGPRVWSTALTGQLLEQALRAGVITKHEVTPSLFEWSAKTCDMNSDALIAFLVERQE